MDVPDKYYDMMVKTPSSFVAKLTPLDVVRDFGAPPAFDEWLIAKCGGFSTTNPQANIPISDCRYKVKEAARKAALLALKKIN